MFTKNRTEITSEQVVQELLAIQILSGTNIAAEAQSPKTRSRRFTEARIWSAWRLTVLKVSAEAHPVVNIRT